VQVTLLAIQSAFCKRTYNAKSLLINNLESSHVTSKATHEAQ